MTPQKAAVNVPAGGAVRQEFDLVLERGTRPGANAETVKLDAFTVAVQEGVQSLVAAAIDVRMVGRLHLPVPILQPIDDLPFARVASDHFPVMVKLRTD